MKEDADSDVDKGKNHDSKVKALMMARAIIATNDKVDTPIPVLLAELAPLKAMKGVKDFKAEAKGNGKFEIYLIGSKLKAREYDIDPKSENNEQIQELGENIGAGGNKEIFEIPGKPDSVIAILKEGKPLDAIEKEISKLKGLFEEGLSTVEVIEQTSYKGRPAFIMKRYAQGSKDIVKLTKGKVRIVGKSDYLNKKSIQDLRKIRDAMTKKKIAIDDLQFLIGKDGSIVIADPLNFYNNVSPSKNNLRMIDLLIESAEQNIK